MPHRPDRSGTRLPVKARTILVTTRDKIFKPAQAGSSGFTACSGSVQLGVLGIAGGDLFHIVVHLVIGEARQGQPVLRVFFLLEQGIHGAPPAVVGCGGRGESRRCFTGSVALHGFKFGEGLEAIFAEKTASFFVVRLDGLFTMPHIPVVAVAVVVIAAAVFTGERGRRPIEALGCVFLHNFGKGDVILIGELFPDLLFIFRILRLVSFLPAPVEPVRHYIRYFRKRGGRI